MEKCYFMCERGLKEWASTKIFKGVCGKVKRGPRPPLRAMVDSCFRFLESRRVSYLSILMHFSSVLARLLTIFIFFQSDHMTQLEKEMDYREEHFDFIQKHIRNFCIKCILIIKFMNHLPCLYYINRHSQSSVGNLDAC